MSRIGILTFHHSINYGALLQAYALSARLTRLGHDVEIIDYHDRARQSARLGRLRRWRHKVRIVTAKALVGNARTRATEEFREKFLPVGDLIFESGEQIKEDPPDYDAYVVGSDQVWNFAHTNADTSYLLDFVSNGGRKISYAASLGTGTVSPKHIPMLTNALRTFDSVSVRELDGRAQLERLLGRSVDVVLDPSLLLGPSDWEEVSSATSRERRPYILCYHMPGIAHVNREISRYARVLSRITGLDVIRIGQREHRRLLPFESNIFDAGPAEFVTLFKRAEFVLTNSFHGTAFAVNFSKPFYSFIDNSIPESRSLGGRLGSLLEQVGLNDRLLGVGRDASPLSSPVLEVDFANSQSRLEELRGDSLHYLVESLRGLT